MTKTKVRKTTRITRPRTSKALQKTPIPTIPTKPAMPSISELADRIHQAKERLDKVGINLKKRFVGIDSIIDEILDNMRVWLAMPELVGRPVIINLWGLTGVGKTDLVRNLVKELQMGDRFVEIQMSRKSSDHNTSIQSVLTHSSIEPDSQGILLLDEMQRYRSINDGGEEYEGNDFQDVWMLLSDGCFAGGSTAKSDIMDMLFADIYWTQDYEQPVKPKSKRDKDRVAQEAKKEKSRKYKRTLFSAKYLKRLLRLTDPVEDIMKWDEHKKYAMLNAALADPSTFEGDSYQQLLIFISGNIDEAYSMSDSAENADVDADVFHQFSSRINLVNIKSALKKRFKPEQIARLGNTHVIYPSLSKISYEKIIDLKVIALLEKIVKCGISITIDQSVKDCIYRNGVFPAQGVRPVLSTLNAMLGNAIPDFIVHAIEQRVEEFTIHCTSTSLVAKIGNKTFRKPVEGAIDKIKKEHDRQQVMLTSVHEAGHAIVYADLFKAAPVQIVANSTHDDNSGWIGIHKSAYAKKDIINLICVYLAGLGAEEWVYGDKYRTNGCNQDLDYATKYAAGSIRRWAMNGRLSATVNKHQDGSNVNYDIEGSNAEIEDMLQKGKDRVMVILEKHRVLFKKVVDILSSDKKVSPEKFQELAAKQGLRIAVHEAKKTLFAVDYINGYGKFRKKRATVGAS